MKSAGRDSAGPRDRFRGRYGRWAVVTGASDGIGREFARELAGRGFDLVLVARREPALQALGTELMAAHGIEVRIIAVDLADKAGVDHVVDATADLDVGLLVAAAGFGTSGPFVAAALAEESGMVAVNCGAVLALSWHFARRFVGRGRGGVVLIGSIVGFQGVPRTANYAATKAYVQTLAEGLHEELLPLGVDVVVAAPGPVRTGFETRADMRMASAMSPAEVARSTLAALGHRTTVRPGLLTKVLSFSLAMLPRWGRTKVMGRVMAGMTAHQTAKPTALDRPAG